MGAESPKILRPKYEFPYLLYRSALRIQLYGDRAPQTLNEGRSPSKSRARQNHLQRPFDGLMGFKLRIEVPGFECRRRFDDSGCLELNC